MSTILDEGEVYWVCTNRKCGWFEIERASGDDDEPCCDGCGRPLERRLDDDVVEVGGGYVSER